MVWMTFVLACGSVDGVDTGVSWVEEKDALTDAADKPPIEIECGTSLDYMPSITTGTGTGSSTNGAGMDCLASITESQLGDRIERYTCTPPTCGDAADADPCKLWFIMADGAYNTTSVTSVRGIGKMATCSAPAMDPLCTCGDPGDFLAPGATGRAFEVVDGKLKYHGPLDNR